MNEGELASRRLEQLLLKENSTAPIGFEKIIQGDLYQLLSCYMQIEKCSMDIRLTPTNRCFDLSIQAKASRLYSPRSIR